MSVFSEEMGKVQILTDTGDRARLNKQARQASRTGDLRDITPYQRKAIKEELAEAKLFTGEFWRTEFGHYSNEPRITRFINERLGSSKTPFIVFDFGGGYGYQWAYLASEKYAKEVKAGKLAFVVSNLSRDPSRATEEELFCSIENSWFGPGLAEAQTLIEYRKNIVYMTGDMNELRRQKVNINGIEIPILGNVGLFHDMLALRHGYVPEVELPQVAMFLQQGGIMMIEPESIVNHNKGDVRGAGWEMFLAAWDTGLANIERVGMVKDVKYSDSAYRVYRKKG